jgi:hypothetical protein
MRYTIERMHPDRPIDQPFLDTDGPLEDFDTYRIALDGVTKVAHVAGTEPAVIAMAETDSAPRALWWTTRDRAPHRCEIPGETPT